MHIGEHANPQWFGQPSATRCNQPNWFLFTICESRNAVTPSATQHIARAGCQRFDNHNIALRNYSREIFVLNQSCININTLQSINSCIAVTVTLNDENFQITARCQSMQSGRRPADNAHNCILWHLITQSFYRFVGIKFIFASANRDKRIVRPEHMATQPPQRANRRMSLHNPTHGQNYPRRLVT